MPLPPLSIRRSSCSTPIAAVSAPSSTLRSPSLRRSSPTSWERPSRASSWSTARTSSTEVCCGWSDHHLDIKSENLLLDSAGHVIIGDFGGAAVLTKEVRRLRAFSFPSKRPVAASSVRPTGWLLRSFVERATTPPATSGPSASLPSRWPRVCLLTLRSPTPWTPWWPSSTATPPPSATLRSGPLSSSTLSASSSPKMYVSLKVSHA